MEIDRGVKCKGAISTSYPAINELEVGDSTLISWDKRYSVRQVVYRISRVTDMKFKTKRDSLEWVRVERLA